MSCKKLNTSQLKVWDVFLLDSDFAIERPRRYYRQGLNLLHADGGHQDKGEAADEKGNKLAVHSDTEHMSLIGTIKGRVSKALRRTDRSRRARTTVDGDDSDDSGDSDPSVSSHPAPLLDPSTNVNPLSQDPEDQQDHLGDENDHPWSEKKKKANANEVSKHTFFVTNSQMRLKLYAKNEVRNVARRH